MSRTLPTMGVLHPLTGMPIRAIGWRPDGRPLWPILGGDDTNPDPDPERPDDVPEQDWDALGDPGKRALVRERGVSADLRRQLAAAKARPTPPPGPPTPKPPAPPAPKPGDQPDIAALIKDAVDAAVKPLMDAEQTRTAEAAAAAVRTAVVNAAKDRLHDGTDGLMIDLTTVVDDQGRPDPAKIGTALDDLVKSKPHLARDTRRHGGTGVGPTPGAAGRPMADQVKDILAEMQTASGVRLPAAPAAN